MLIFQQRYGRYEFSEKTWLFTSFSKSNPCRYTSKQVNNNKYAHGNT